MRNDLLDTFHESILVPICNGSGEALCGEGEAQDEWLEKHLEL